MTGSGTVVVHIYNPSTQEAEQAEGRPLGYIFFFNFFGVMLILIISRQAPTVPEHNSYQHLNQSRSNYLQEAFTSVSDMLIFPHRWRNRKDL